MADVGDEGAERAEDLVPVVTVRWRPRPTASSGPTWIGGPGVIRLMMIPIAPSVLAWAASRRVTGTVVSVPSARRIVSVTV